jgi:hypothetical protein
MKVYLAVGGNKRIHQFAQKYNCGWLMTPYNCRNPPLGLPYCNDNGKFRVYSEELKGNRIEWKEQQFFKFLDRYPNYDFVVVPDVVCPEDPLDSLNLSLQYVNSIKRPRYLAVQDGMTMEMVRYHLHKFDGIFIGGSLEWKFTNAHMWADIAKLYKIKCHAGRVGTWEGLDHMDRCGVDTVDSSTASRNNDPRCLLKYFTQQKLI